jgi:hypothetical protein
MFISPSKRITIPPPPPAAPSTSQPRSLSPSKSIRSLAQHLQAPSVSLSPTKGSPLKTRTEVSSLRKKIDDAEREEDVEGNDGVGDRGKKNKKGLWNLFNAEYEI